MMTFILTADSRAISCRFGEEYHGRAQSPVQGSLLRGRISGQRDSWDLQPDSVPPGAGELVHHCCLREPRRPVILPMGMHPQSHDGQHPCPPTGAILHAPARNLCIHQWSETAQGPGPKHSLPHLAVVFPSSAVGAGPPSGLGNGPAKILHPCQRVAPGKGIADARASERRPSRGPGPGHLLSHLALLLSSFASSGLR